MYPRFTTQAIRFTKTETKADSTVGNPTTGTTYIEAKEDVRGSIDAASTANMEYGAGFHDHREFEEYGEWRTLIVRIGA